MKTNSPSRLPLRLFPVMFLVLSLPGCRSFVAEPQDFPLAIDTSDRPIAFQERKVYHSGGVYASNRFEGARLNGFRQLDERTWEAFIAPENRPINSSPWYAFQLWSDSARTIRLLLRYDSARHRYFPKISPNGQWWRPLDSTAFELLDTNVALLTLRLQPDTLWLAAQELETSGRVEAWCRSLALHPAVEWTTIDTSRLGNPLWMLDIGAGPRKGKDLIVLLGRQHPPEVTGWLALKAFLDEILGGDKRSRDFLRRYRLLVFPLMNPDGVDHGHWRHNAGGVDLNRDWAQYRQPETRAVADAIVREAGKYKNRVLLGLDFHSTFYDIFYTISPENRPHSTLPHFTEQWLQTIQDAFPDEEIIERGRDEQRPVAKSWFFVHFGALGFTYEVGDDTPRERIRRKAQVAARSMMQLLLQPQTAPLAPKPLTGS
ncbi:MAG: hypothetical protein D6765_08410 [Bacteroidetes bacterium]|nr:MAG: hypothetical protein D6765_08410 [Bacteroidota bacterium]